MSDYHQQCQCEVYEVCPVCNPEKHAEILKQQATHKQSPAVLYCDHCQEDRDITNKNLAHQHGDKWFCNYCDKGPLREPSVQAAGGYSLHRDTYDCVSLPSPVFSIRNKINRVLAYSQSQPDAQTIIDALNFVSGAGSELKPEGSLCEVLKELFELRRHSNNTNETLLKRIEELEGNEDRLMTERDEAEEAIDQAYFLITGRSPEWSNAFGYKNALEEIESLQSSHNEAVKAAEWIKEHEEFLASAIKNEIENAGWDAVQENKKMLSDLRAILAKGKDII